MGLATFSSLAPRALTTKFSRVLFFLPQLLRQDALVKENIFRHAFINRIVTVPITRERELDYFFYHGHLFGPNSAILVWFLRGWAVKNCLQAAAAAASHHVFLGAGLRRAQTFYGKICACHPENNCVDEVHRPASRPVSRVYMGIRNLETAGGPLFELGFRISGFSFSLYFIYFM